MTKTRSEENIDIQTYYDLFDRLFDEFLESRPEKHKKGRPPRYQEKVLILFFTIMQVKRILLFKSQHRWLATHPNQALQLGFITIPHRVTLSRRYKTLANTISDFISYVGKWAESVDDKFSSRTLYADGSLFTSHGGKWHKSNRDKNEIPYGARCIDRDSSWSKSRYHSWVQGYSLHYICNYHGFPKIAQVSCLKKVKNKKEKGQKNQGDIKSTVKKMQ